MGENPDLFESVGEDIEFAIVVLIIIYYYEINQSAIGQVDLDGLDESFGSFNFITRMYPISPKWLKKMGF